MKEKFTQSEWLKTDGAFVYALNEQGVNRFFLSVMDPHCPEEELQANAHLIAASPKLYRRLQYLTDMMREEYPGIAETSDKLLAEARGEK